MGVGVLVSRSIFNVVHHQKCAALVETTVFNYEEGGGGVKQYEF